ncbi:MAG TPA: Mpo1-like protein [Telmatospirillum sp.]|nr:Mpo1-like protein [Telmatospirillum sp.]
MTSLAQQMVSYGRYHRDRRNRLTHFVGVPLIIFAILIPMSLARFVAAGVEVTLAEVFIVICLAYYTVLDTILALTLAVIIAPILWSADRLAHQSISLALAVFLVCFLCGWAVQFLGHRFEGNKPALLDNIFQIFAAPIFLTGEAAFALGYRSDLRREIADRMTTDDIPEGPAPPSPR